MPILQSMYAETLRLYTSHFVFRSALLHGDFDFCNFKVPKDELVAVDSRVAAMDANFWNTGPTTSAHEGVHHLNGFWAERFVEYPDDPISGPLRYISSKPRAPRPNTTSAENSKEPHFTIAGKAGT